MIGVTGHGEYVVDRINAYDKRCLMRKIYMISTPKDDDN